MTFRSDGDTANVVGGGSAFRPDDEVDKGAFPNPGFSCNDDVTD